MSVYDEGRGTAPAAAGDAALVSRSVEVPERAVDAFLSGQPTPRIAWVAPDGETVAAAGAAVTITAHDCGRFETICETAATAFEGRDVPRTVPPPARPRFVGGFAFHSDHGGNHPWEGFPPAAFVIPRVRLSRTVHGTWLTVNAYGADVTPDGVEATLEAAASALDDRSAPPRRPPGVRRVRRRPERTTWCGQVDAALDRIDDGTLRKVVLAGSLEAALDRPVDPPNTLERMGDRYPDCYRFLFAPTEAATVLGATPERLVSLRGRTVETEALAGSIGRGGTPVEDDALARELAESTKDRHEHALVVDALRDQLGPLASTVATAPRRVRRLESVQHLQTTVRARLTGDRHVLSLVEALHPTPAVGGLPPEAALAVIRETEAFERGWYAAPIGWFDARGNGEFAVAIRSAVAAERTATLFAGAGIVADSDPDTEWEEVQLKYRPVLDALRE